VDLPQLIQSAWHSLEPLAQVKQLTLDYQGPAQYLVNLDEPLFHRVLLNLIDNAIKHSPASAPIYVRLAGAESATENAGEDSTSTEDDGFYLDIIDIGPGFNPKDLPHVFDRFYRADLSRSRSGLSPSSSPGQAVLPVEMSRGTGLGLAIVSQIVEAHGGTISAANHPDLGGAWLQLWLPDPALD
jgi:two-component system phosphate regulon sensor histidine kinase PhoR